MNLIMADERLLGSTSHSFASSHARALRGTAVGAARRTQVRPRRIFIDCTPTFRHDCGTGVQRVVRNLVNWSPAAGRKLKVKCRGVRYDDADGFQMVISLPETAPAEPARENGEPLPASKPPDNPALKEALKRTLSATGMLDPARWIRRNVHRGCGSAKEAIARVRYGSPTVELGAGDVLFLCDTIWATPEIWQGIRQGVAHGAKLGALVYDLIPLHFANLYGPEFAGVFGDWLDNILELADFVVCISRSTWEDLQRYMAVRDVKRGRRAPLAGSWFRLGEGLDARNATAEVRPQLRDLFGDFPQDNPYLVVGSFDPRKDLSTVIKAFERLWARGAGPRLVSIGRSVPGHPSAIERLVLEHPEHGRRLYCFGDVGDAELDFCYRRSAALITASYAEGFNLPIVESLGRGRPVLASDIPVHREVAGSYASYFAPRAADELAAVVERHHAGQLRELATRLDRFRWPNWRESSRELLERIIELYPDTAASAHLAARLILKPTLKMRISRDSLPVSILARESSASARGAGLMPWKTQAAVILGAAVTIRPVLMSNSVKERTCI